MTVKFIGNHGKGYKGNGIDGSGIWNLPVEMGYMSATADTADDEGIVQISSIVTGDINQGIFFQSEVALEVTFTACNPGMATSADPAMQAATMWTNPLTVPAQTITKAEVLFTAMKLKFSAPGTCYIIVR